MKKLVCVKCPLGCKMKVFLEEKTGILEVEGNRCPRGVEYAEEEFFDPKRILTSSVRILNGELELVSVKTDRAVPKRMMKDIMKVIKELKVEAPVKSGEVLVKDLSGSGASLVVTRSVKRKSE